jgi:hypothetical protein
MGKSAHMKSTMMLTVTLVSVLFGVEAHSKSKSSADNSPQQNTNTPEQVNGESKTPKNSKVLRSSLTLKQVEKATGGQVIGVRQVSFQGRQLNMIKLKMPDGRIRIYSRLFDENGRSVENIDSMEDIQELESSDIEQ